MEDPGSTVQYIIFFGTQEGGPKNENENENSPKAENDDVEW